MKLYWSSRSPFVRKVMVVAHETGLDSRIECVRTVVSAMNPNVELMPSNPLAKLPTLLLDDGTSLYDSCVICEFLDTRHAGARLFPLDWRERLQALRWQALGDGMMDFSLSRLMERSRPEGQRADSLIVGARAKLAASLAALEAAVPALDALPLSVGCALSCLDFRFAADGWREGHAALAAWHATFAARPSMLATDHVDAY